MPFKPMPLRIFQKYLRLVNWKLEKGSIDHNLYDEFDNLVCSIKVSHGKNTKSNEVVAQSVRKVEKEFKKRGDIWPPKK